MGIADPIYPGPPGEAGELSFTGLPDGVPAAADRLVFEKDGQLYTFPFSDLPGGPPPVDSIDDAMIKASAAIQLSKLEPIAQNTIVARLASSGAPQATNPSTWSAMAAPEDADKLLGQTSAGNLAFATMLAVWTYIQGKVAAEGYQATSEKGAVNGYAPLGADGKVPAAMLPLSNFYQHRGTWDASTNTPALTSGVGEEGDAYVVTVDGSTALDGIGDWKSKDLAVYLGGAWRKIDNTDSVLSVCGKTGAVTLTADDLESFDVLAVLTADGSDLLAVERAAGGDKRKLTLAALATWVQGQISGLAMSALEAWSGLAELTSSTLDPADLLAVADTDAAGARKKLSLAQLLGWVGAAQPELFKGSFPVYPDATLEGGQLRHYVGRSGTVQRLYIRRTGASPSSGSSYYLDLKKNGSGILSDVCDLKSNPATENTWHSDSGKVWEIVPGAAGVAPGDTLDILVVSANADLTPAPSGGVEQGTFEFVAVIK